MKNFLWNLLWNRGIAWRIVRIAGTTYALFLALWLVFEDRFVYLSAKYPDGPWDLGRACPVKDDIGPAIEEVSFSAPDGVRLHAWRGSCSRGTEKGFEPLHADRTILWFHGNGGNVAFHYVELLDMVDSKADVFIVDYRGYGKSEGEPSEAGLAQDALGAWKFLTETAKIPPDRILVFGEGLGAAVAIDLAGSVKPAGLVLQSVSTSVPDLVGPILPILPRALIRTKFDALRTIPNVSCPILFVHSRADEVVPIEQGRRVFDAAKAPKEFFEIADTSHEMTWRLGKEPYRKKFQEFLDRCVPTTWKPPPQPPRKAKAKRSPADAPGVDSKRPESGTEPPPKAPPGAP